MVLTNFRNFANKSYHKSVFSSVYHLPCFGRSRIVKSRAVLTEFHGNTRWVEPQITLQTKGDTLNPVTKIPKSMICCALSLRKEPGTHQSIAEASGDWYLDVNRSGAQIGQIWESNIFFRKVSASRRSRPRTSWRCWPPSRRPARSFAPRSLRLIYIKIFLKNKALSYNLINTNKQN